MTLTRWCALLFVAACTSALSAHIAIDVLGDVLLPHDAYDDVAHGSRTLIGGAIGMLLLAVVARTLFCLFVNPPAAAPRTTRRRDAVGFVAAALACAFAALVAMEALDVLQSGAGIDDLSDLLGGDWRLGGGLLAAITIPCAWACWFLANAIGRVPARVLALVSQIARRVCRGIRLSLALEERRRRERLSLHRTFLIPRLLGRAPPACVRLRPVFAPL